MIGDCLDCNRVTDCAEQGSAIVPDTGFCDAQLRIDDGVGVSGVNANERRRRRRNGLHAFAANKSDHVRQRNLINS